MTRAFLNALKWTVIGIIVLTAVSLGVARLLLPMAGQYRAAIEHWVGESLGQPVNIGRIDAQWRGLNPSLYIEDVSLLDKTGARTLAHALQTRVYLDVPASIRQRQLKAGGLEVNAATLSLTRRTDGSIGFTGTEDDGLHHGRFSRWLLKQGRLSVTDSQVYLSDERVGGAPQRYANIDLLLTSDGRHRHHVEGALELPEGTGKIHTLTVDFTGDVSKPQEWTGSFFGRGEDVSLTHWLVARSLLGISLGSGRADLGLRGVWKGGTISLLEGDVTARDLYLKSIEHGDGVNIKRAAGHFAWNNEGNRWTLAVDRLNAARTSLPESFDVAFVLSPDGGKTVDTRFDFARLEDLSPLLLASSGLKPKLRAALAGLQPRAELYDLEIHWRKPPDDRRVAERQLEIQSRLVNYSSRSWKRLPGVAGLKGVLSANQNSGKVDIDSRAAQLNVDEWYSDALQLTAVAGQVRWQRAGERVHIETEDLQLSDAAFSGRLRGSMEFTGDDGDSPLVDLEIDLEQGAVAAIPRFIPVKLRERAVSQWLARALVAGRITSGHALIQGRLRDFPFYADPGKGKLDLDLALDGAVLDYAPEWPRIDGIETALSFRGTRFELHATGGRIANADIREAHAVIPELGEKSELTMESKVAGTSTTALGFIRHSPLQAKFGAALAGLDAKGSALLDIDMLLTFPKPKPKIKGVLTLSANTVSWRGKEQTSAIELRKVNGTLNFTEASLQGKDIEAELSGQKMRLGLATETPAQTGQEIAQKALLIKARGTIRTADIVKHMETALPEFAADIPDYLEGATDWSATLRIHKQDNETSVADLSVHSTLQGMAVRLPEPLGKSADESLDLAMETTLSQQSTRRVNIRYGDRLSSLLELATTKDSWQLGRGEVRLGAGKISQLPAQGVRISGELPNLSSSAWDDQLSAKSSASSSSDALAQLNAIDVRLISLELAGQSFANVRISANKTTQAWVARIDSTQLAGDLRYTPAPNHALTMDFERLHLAKPPDDDKPETNRDPRLWPALAVTSDSFKYGDLDLGRLSLIATKQSDGLHVEKLELTAPALAVAGKGTWTFKAGRSTSRFDIKISAEELGETLTALGYDANIAGGQSDFALSAEWPGAPAQFALARLKGTLAMDIKKGRLLDVEPGAGRIFGLLSVQALPRRLSLDFSDLFAKGFAFDRILGEFTIEKGNAYTESLVTTSPAANILVTGRTGLAAQDYEQIVTVRPELGGGIALAGALMGGPGVGAAILLAQQLFKSPLGDIGTRYYRITGPWQDSVLTRVDKTAVDKQTSQAVQP